MFTIFDLLVIGFAIGSLARLGSRLVLFVLVRGCPLFVVPIRDFGACLGLRFSRLLFLVLSGSFDLFVLGSRSLVHLICLCSGLALWFMTILLCVVRFWFSSS
ncbi:hypothetical protein U1Q18_011222 [Sarracenia purpurea var. burkii]